MVRVRLRGQGNRLVSDEFPAEAPHTGSRKLAGRVAGPVRAPASAELGTIVAPPGFTSQAMSTPIPKTLQRIAGTTAIALASVSGAGCYGSTTATYTTETYTRAGYQPAELYGYQVVYVETPPNIAYYPRTY